MPTHKGKWTKDITIQKALARVKKTEVSNMATQRHRLLWCRSTACRFLQRFPSE
jgi:hypothetical protein